MSVPCKYTNVSPFEPLGSWNWSQAWLKSGKRYTVSLQFLWISNIYLVIWARGHFNLFWKVLKTRKYDHWNINFCWHIKISWGFRVNDFLIPRNLRFLLKHHCWIDKISTCQKLKVSANKETLLQKHFESMFLTMLYGWANRKETKHCCLQDANSASSRYIPWVQLSNIHVTCHVLIWNWYGCLL